MSRRREKAQPCPTSAKTAWGSEEAATEALAAILEQRDAWREKLPCRVYVCSCGRWHLTSDEGRSASAMREPSTTAVAMARIHAAASRA